MNIYTTDIMELLEVTKDVALQVQEKMEENCIDFSECSKKEFKQEALIAYSEMHSI